MQQQSYGTDYRFHYAVHTYQANMRIGALNPAYRDKVKGMGILGYYRDMEHLSQEYCQEQLKIQGVCQTMFMYYDAIYLRELLVTAARDDGATELSELCTVPAETEITMDLINDFDEKLWNLGKNFPEDLSNDQQRDYDGQKHELAIRLLKQHLGI